MRIVCFGPLIVDYQIQLANALCKKETVMLSLPAIELPSEYMDNISEGVRLQLIVGRRPTWHPANLRHFRDFIKGIRDFKPDVVHFQLGGHVVNLVAFVYCKYLKRYPVIVTFHDVKIHPGTRNDWKVNFTRSWMRKYSDEIIVHGQRLRKQMITEYNIPSEKVHAIFMGENEVAPFKKYEREDIKESGNLVLFFGGIAEYKGLEYLIKAEPLITKEIPNAKIVIAGTGENFAKYEKMMVNRRDNFIVHNYRISYKEGAELFQRSSVVVLPYIEASQSGVIYPAYGFKKPVIVTNVGSLPEIVDNGITGFVVPPRDSEALAETVIKLLKDANLRKEMGENGYRKLKTDLSWDRIAEETIEVYKKALKI